MIVLFAHIISTSATYGMYVSGCGKIGVWCFLVISGFLTVYNVKKDDSEKVYRYISKYYLNKIIRLYPAYIIGLILAYKFGFITEMENVFFLIGNTGWGHFWYMPVILKYYLIAPIFIIAYKKMNPAVFGVVVGVIGTVFSVLYPYTECPENSTILRWYIPVFIMGMLVCLMYKHMDGIKNEIIFITMFIIGVISALIFTPYIRKVFWDVQPSRWLQNKYLLYGIIWSIILFSVIKSRYISKLFEKCRILKFIGEISYEVYIVHYIILLYIGNCITNTITRGLWTVVVSLFVATIVHYIMEYIIKSIRKSNLKT